MQDLQLLSNTALDFLTSPSDLDIYRYIGEKLSDIAGESIVSVNSYDPGSDSLVTRALVGLGKIGETVTHLIGWDPIGMSFKIRDEEARSALLTGKLFKGPRGVHELTFGKVPWKIANKVDQLLGIGAIYGIGFSWGGRLYGNAMIASRSESGLLEKKDTIELFIRQASMALQRKEVEDALRQSEERYRFMLAVLPAAMYSCNAEGVITYYNEQASRVWGRSPVPGDVNERFCGSFRMYRPDGSPLPHDRCPMAAVLQHGISVRAQEIIFERPDGSRVHVSANIHPVRDMTGAITGALNVLTDITDRKQMEKELRRAHDRLEQRVRDRTIELERKNRELQEFAFVASHDLSEPLRKIQTFGSILVEKSADRLNAQEKDYISRMTGAANRMQELLDALLSYSRIDTRGQEFRPTGLGNVLKDAAGDLEVSIRNLGARVEIGPLPVIEGDPRQLRQLFQNLLANALKYHRPEVAPLIKVYAEAASGAARVSVEDNGIGFDEKYLDKIFQPFQRLHGRNDYPGTGIGLAICKKIVERHGGTITARSRQGEGSTFVIEIPKAR